MAFWGIELNKNKPFTLRFTGLKRRLCITRATLVDGSPLVSPIRNYVLPRDMNIVRIVVGNQPPIALCSLSRDKKLSCRLNLELEETQDVIFTLQGSGTVNLTGYYIRDTFEGDNTKIRAGGVPIDNTPIDNIFLKGLLEKFIEQSTKGKTMRNDNQKNSLPSYLVDDKGTTSEPCGQMVIGSASGSFHGPHLPFDGQQLTGVTIEEPDSTNALVEIVHECEMENRIDILDKLSNMVVEETVGHREVNKCKDVIIEEGENNDLEEKTPIIPTTEQMNGKSASDSNKINDKKSERESFNVGLTREMKTVEKRKSVMLAEPCNAFERELLENLNKKPKM